jgi:hypothetical protein
MRVRSLGMDEEKRCRAGRHRVRMSVNMSGTKALPSLLVAIRGK